MAESNPAAVREDRSVHRRAHPVMWSPTWVQSIQTAVWITSPERQIGYINPQACRLLNVTAKSAVGQFCHEVVSGRDTAGSTFCSDHCPALTAARGGRTIEPVSLQIGPGPHAHWVKLLVIAARHPKDQGTHLVHCALDDDRARRVESYLSRVILRTNPADNHFSQLEDAGLTRRELDVLRMLAEDESLHGIALRLDISYVTVRNHVQHLLAKLGLHSIMEAVALYLLTVDEPPKSSPDSP